MLSWLERVNKAAILGSDDWPSETVDARVGCAPSSRERNRQSCVERFSILGVAKRLPFPHNPAQPCSIVADHWKPTGQRLNKNVRFVFLNEQRQSEANATFLEFSLGASGITDEVFLHVVDYSPSESDEDKREMWDGLVDKLREQVGG